MKKEKIYPLNIIRVICVIAIFMYHTYWNGGCNYKELNFIINQSVVWMTLFFILSGFVLRYNYMDKDLNDTEELKKYIKKRIISIFPIYFIIYIIFLLMDSGTSIYQHIVTFPAKFLLLQEFQHYDYLTNSGTWFFSCIFFCYLIFPYANTILSKIKMKTSIITCLVLWILSISNAFIAIEYNIGIYNNIFIRTIEFLIGVCLAQIVYKKKEKLEKFNKYFIDRKLWIPISLICIFGIYILEKYVPIIHSSQFFLMPYTSTIGIFIILSFTSCKDKLLNNIGKSKFITFLSDYSLEIWCATFFTTEIMASKHILNLIGNNHWNIKKILLFFIVNFIIAIILKLYEKLIKKIIEKINLKKTIYVYILILIIILIFKIFIMKLI